MSSVATLASDQSGLAGSMGRSPRRRGSNTVKPGLPVKDQVRDQRL